VAATALNLDLVDHPEIASTPIPAARIAAWYWTKRKINVPADRGDVIAVTKLINGGTSGLVHRQAWYEKCRTILG
jgi:putative chitinase